MKRKVFIGLSDIASFIEDWDYGFKQNGYDTYKGSLNYQSPFQTSKLDFVIKKGQDLFPAIFPEKITSKLKTWWDKWVKEYYFNRALKECEIFVFIWNTFYHDCSDLKRIREKNRKIIIVFVGDEIRWEPAMKQEFFSLGLPIIEYKDYDFSDNSLIKKLQYLRLSERYANVLLSQPNISQLAIKPYSNLFIPVIAERFKEVSKQNSVPHIVHAPTSTGKGTRFIEPTINRLIAEGLQFTYERIENVPREAALKIYEKADIIIDQLLTPGGGKLAHEGLAMGKIVLTLMAYDNYDQKKPSECPLVDVNEKNLYNTLKGLIPNHNLRSEIAAKGRPYIEKFHNPKNIIADALKRSDDIKFDSNIYQPKFFREEFVPENENLKRVYNKWTETVMDCDWYKTFVKSGERDGLIF